MTSPMALWAYQEDGARFLAPRARAGLFDKPRVGKTAQAIRGLDLRGARRGIVVCPAVARENWKWEFGRFQLVPRSVVKGVNNHDFVAWLNGRFDVLVTSYEQMVKWSQFIHERCEILDFIIYDEAHGMKSAETKRSQYLLGPDSDGCWGLTMWAEVAWWLTGTPTPNDPLDIYTWLKFQRATDLDRNGFAERYFDVVPRKFGSRQYAKREMLPELHQMIAANSMCRTLADTGADLPPITLTTYMVDGNDSEVRRLLLEHPGLDTKIMDAIKSGTGLAGLESGHSVTLRRLLAEAKAVPYADTIRQELENGLDRIVIFGHHTAALNLIRDHLEKHGIKTGMLVGGVSENGRKDVQDFFRDGSVKAVIANIRAAGVAINLTAGAALDMFEQDWAPQMNYQALMRVYGPTQRRGVRIRMITLNNKFSQEMTQTIADKTAALADLDLNPEKSIQGAM